MTIATIYQLPEKGFVRLRQLLGDKKANPPTPPIIPIGRTSWLNGVKSGKYPKPVKLGERTTACLPAIRRWLTAYCTAPMLRATRAEPRTARTSCTLMASRPAGLSTSQAALMAHGRYQENESR